MSEVGEWETGRLLPSDGAKPERPVQEKGLRTRAAKVSASVGMLALGSGAVAWVWLSDWRWFVTGAVLFVLTMFVTGMTNRAS